MTDAATAPGRLNPWLDMWTRPRVTMRRILDTDPHRHVALVAALAGVERALGEARWPEPGEADPLAAILATVLIAGPLVGLAVLYVWGGLIWLAGRWIGGAAEAFQLRVAVAWSQVPAVWLLLLVPFELAVFGGEMFRAETPRIDASVALSVLQSGLFLVYVAVSAWVVVLMARSVAEAQGFASAWRGFGNMLLALLVAAVPVLVLAVLIRAMTAW